MAAAVATFLSQAARRGFVWGQHDCMMFAADWAKALTGCDPASSWRASYASEGEAAAILEDAGGPEAHMDRTLGPCGWRPIDPREAATGDIVLAHAPHHREAVAAVCIAGKAALLTRRGLVIWPVPFIAAWRHG